MSEELFDAHGEALFALARMVLLDRDAAESETVGAFRDAVRAPVRSLCEPGRGELTRYLYARCRRRLEDPGASGHESRLPQLPGLSARHRSALALGLYGGLTYREIADLIELPAAVVADVIRSALHGAHPRAGVRGPR